MQRDVYLQQMCKVADNFRRYINQMVIIGFNSGSYDNLIRGELTKISDFDDRKLAQCDICRELGLDEEVRGGEEEGGEEEEDPNERGGSIDEEILHIIQSSTPKTHAGDMQFIKRVNRYLSISNNHFKFIDAMSYLPPHTSYKKCLESFNIPASNFFSLTDTAPM